MTKILLLCRNFSIIVALLLTSETIAQTTVFSDDFTTSQGANYTTANGLIGTSSTWSLARSGSDFGSRITSGVLALTNDASTASNVWGSTVATVNNANFNNAYSPILNSNPGLVTWTFNVRQPKANPSGFTTNLTGVAFILAGTSGSSNAVGQGYAVVLGNTTTTDPLKLVRYNNGLQNTTTLITSNTTGLADFGKQYLSVKVTFSPLTQTWQMYIRNDGTTFQNPQTGSLTSQGSVVNNTYSGTALGIMGAYWSTATQRLFIAQFDNVAVTVEVPELYSITPPSKTAGTGAFTLTLNGDNFTPTSVVRWNGASRPTTYISAIKLTAAISASDIASPGEIPVKVTNGLAVSNTQFFTIDAPLVPTLSVSTNALSAFTTVTGTASSTASYQISGTDLSTIAIITAPQYFEVSTNATTGFADSINLAQSAGNLMGQPVTVYCRVKASTPFGIYSGNISNASSGAPTKLVAVSATVLAAQPLSQSTNLTFTDVTSASMKLQWTNGPASNHLVVMRAASAVNAAPIDGTNYVGGTAFQTGSQLGTGNYAVYSGASSSVTVTGLTPNTVYHVAIYDYNGNATTSNYLSTSPLIGNKTTLNLPVGWQIFATNVLNTLNFDDTVDGVNLGAFQGDGVKNPADLGELNSLAWSFSGFTSGNINFGGNSADDSDYDQGSSEGGVDIPGLYAFETKPDNFSIGVKPVVGNFAPGTTTLRFQNQTGTAVTSLNIGYTVYIYNNGNGSNSFNFSHSANNSSYTPMLAVNLSTPAAPDADAQWKAYHRVITLTGINIPNNQYYYLRWNSEVVSGTDLDEIALDDIQLTANPTTTFATFSGLANQFTVAGNAKLSADLTVVEDLTLQSGKLDLNAKTLSLKGIVNNNVVGGLKGGASSNITVNGTASPTLSFDQTTIGTTNSLSNLSILTTGGATVTIANPVTINGTLTIQGNQTLNMGTNALAGTLAGININGTLATQNTSALPIPTGKSWNGTINYNGVASQTAVTGTYNNLTIANTFGATASGALTVNGILNLPLNNPNATTGSLSMVSNTLLMGANATNIGAGDVTGIITRNAITANVVYSFGHEHTAITFPAVGTLPTSMSLKISIGTTPSWRAGAIKRHFDFIQTGAASTKAVIKAHYLDSELNGNNESKLVDWAYIVSSLTSLEQGRSNFNTSENWVELTNVNVALYFTSSFNNVNLTLDESEASTLTWNGSVSTSWTTAANWTPNATPSDETTVYIPNATTTPRDPLLNPTVLLGKLVIEIGGILDAPANSQFTIKGGAGAWLNSGIYNAGTGTSAVIFTNADATIGGTTTFNNLKIATTGGLRLATGSYTAIADVFTNEGLLYSAALNNVVEYKGTNQVIAIPNAGLQAYDNLIINGTGAVFPSVLSINGDLTLNQNVDFTGKSILFIGNQLQTIKGSAEGIFTNVTINNSFGQVNLGSNTTIANLNLTNGLLNVGTKTLTLGASPVVGTFSSQRMIVASEGGVVRRPFSALGTYFFPIGEASGAIQYSPISVNINSGTLSNAYVSVSVTDAVHPNNSSAANNISRFWTVQQTGITNAIADITANYLTADLTGTENTISAAQLSGVFNQQNNGWIKYATLAAQTLSISNAALSALQPSIFSGIKGGNFSVEISGYGSFCQNENVVLTAETTEGDGPYTYTWSAGSASGNTNTITTTLAGTTSYSVVVKDNNGLSAQNSATVIVLSPSVAGTLNGNQQICYNSVPADIILSGSNGQILYWQSSDDEAFSNPMNIGNFTTILTSAQIGNITTPVYFRAVVKNGSCAEVYSPSVKIFTKSTTWNGSSWDNGTPNSQTAAIISGNFTTALNLSACSLVVQNGAEVTIQSGADINLYGKLTVESGTLTLQNNANLIQQLDVQNSGNIAVKRNSSALKRLDYTLWSSPVDSQNMLAFSPLTSVMPSSRFYNYNPETHLFSAITAPSAFTFASANGYLIRMPNNHPTTATIWNGSFTGVPNNGNYSFNISPTVDGNLINLVGNPYPSPLSAAQFVADNQQSITGTLYFWRKTNNSSMPTYCSWTAIGGFVDNNEAEVYDPLGIIQTGQGFFVEGKTSNTFVQFNNSQRSGDNAGQFFRNQEIEKNRMWLNVTGNNGAFAQMLLGYFTGATLGVDQNIDGRYINEGALSLTTKINNVDYIIEGRPLPFDVSDVVPLHFKADIAGDYTLAIDHVDGIFDGTQTVYLRDNLNNVIHSLSESGYAFSTVAGTFDNRFEILYQQQLGTDNPIKSTNLITAIAKDNAIQILSSAKQITSVEIYDIRGRLITRRDAINANTVEIPLASAQQVLIVKITDSDGLITTQKLIY